MTENNHIEGVRELVELLRAKGFIPYCPDHIAEALITDFIEKLEAGKWIPVTERLPGKDSRFLALTRVKRVIVGYYYDNDFYDAGDMKRDVTHWQPLPPAPKEIKP